MCLSVQVKKKEAEATQTPSNLGLIPSNPSTYTDIVLNLYSSEV